MIRNTAIALATGAALFAASPSWADDFVIDTKGAHASINFKVSHLGYSWLTGRFNTFEGAFSYDEAAPENATVEVTIDTASVDSNHAKRDKHLRSEDFLEVDKYPQAKFVSTSFSENGDGTAKMAGKFTLHGVTRDIEIDVTHIGAGKDPWGGYRRGLEGTTQIKLADYGMPPTLGPNVMVDLHLVVEGIRK